MRLVKHRGYWAVRWKGKRYSLRTTERALADQRFEDFKKHVETKKETVGQIVKAYLSAKADKSSIRGMEDAWKAASVTFGNLRPDQVNREICGIYAQDRRDNDIAAGTVRKELGVIRQALKWHDPKASPQIELPPAPPPKDRRLTKAEFNLLLKECIQPHLKLFVMLARGTAARKGALLDLTWKQVDLEKGLITLSKGIETNKRRAIVPINETLKTALLDSKKDSLSEYVINYAGQRVKSINKGFREACFRASGGKVADGKKVWGDKSWQEVTPHTIRHSAACWMAEDGVEMSQIAQYLGHSNMNTTYRVYARYSPDYLRKASKALEW